MRHILIFVFVVCLGGVVSAAELPRAKPGEIGLDPAGLAGVDKVVQAAVEKQSTPGAVVAIARKGKVGYLKSFGAFKQDSIFRIYSMSKPITVAAALMLVDEGELALDDPVSKFIPAFAELTIHDSAEKPRPMTVKHLMQHTAGLTYGFFSSTPVDRLYQKARLLEAPSLEAMVQKVAEIPLLFEPGARWHYSVATDVLGRVIEIVAKKPFDVFLQERLFTPLGMTDTGFFIPDEKLDRFLPCYGPTCNVLEATATSRFRKKPGLLSGGGGLVSTMADYMTFLLMMAEGGTWKGKRYLEAKTVELMTTNQLPQALVPIRMGLPLRGIGFGLGVSVRVETAGRERSIGTWGWGGAASTTFIVDPAQDLVVVSLIQRMPMWTGLDQAVKQQAYAAIVKPATAAK